MVARATSCGLITLVALVAGGCTTDDADDDAAASVAMTSASSPRASASAAPVETEAVPVETAPVETVPAPPEGFVWPADPPCWLLTQVEVAEAFGVDMEPGIWVSVSPEVAEQALDGCAYQASDGSATAQYGADRSGAAAGREAVENLTAVAPALECTPFPFAFADASSGCLFPENTDDSGVFHTLQVVYVQGDTVVDIRASAASVDEVERATLVLSETIAAKL